MNIGKNNKRVKKLKNEELHNVHLLPNLSYVIKSRMIKCLEHTEHMEKGDDNIRIGLHEAQH